MQTCHHLETHPRKAAIFGVHVQDEAVGDKQMQQQTKRSEVLFKTMSIAYDTEYFSKQNIIQVGFTSTATL